MLARARRISDGCYEPMAGFEGELYSTAMGSGVPMATRPFRIPHRRGSPSPRSDSEGIRLFRRKKPPKSPDRAIFAWTSPAAFSLLEQLLSPCWTPVEPPRGRSGLAVRPYNWKHTDAALDPPLRCPI